MERPIASSEQKRRDMSNQRNRDTVAEVAIRSALYRRGLRFRLHVRPVPGVRRSADIVFASARVAVMVDGCFWHSCPEHATAPKSNAAWWQQKLARNVERDRDTDERFKLADWRVVRIWEHEAVADAAERVERVVREPNIRSKATGAA